MLTPLGSKEINQGKVQPIFITNLGGVQFQVLKRLAAARSAGLIIHTFISILLSHHSIVAFILLTILVGRTSFISQDIGHIKLDFLSRACLNYALSWHWDARVSSLLIVRAGDFGKRFLLIAPF